MKKEPFVTNEQLQEIVKQFPTPFQLYDEKGIRENAQAVRDAFSWNPGFREYFAVKAEPNPFIIKILQEYGCENLYLKKTGQTALDEEGNELDVWMLSFKPEDMEGDAD